MIISPLNYFHKLKKLFGLYPNGKKNRVESIIETEELNANASFPAKFRKLLYKSLLNKKIYIGGVLLIVLSMAGNVLNFFYNAYLGRVLDLKDFALIGLMGGLLSFVQTIFSSFTTTINYKSGFLIGKYGENTAYAFLKIVRKKALIISFATGLFWIILTPFLIHFFPSGTYFLFILFALALFVGLAEGANRGFLSAKLLFGYVALINIIDPIIRLFIAFILIQIHHPELTYSAMPIAIFGSYLLGYLLILNQKQKGESRVQAKNYYTFPFKFFFASFITGISSIVFLSLDILLANHYLSAREAGSYGLLTLVAKMIYFLGALITPFTVPLISRSEGAKRNSKHTLYILAGGTLLFSCIGFIVFGVFAKWTLPLLYGKKVYTILPYVMTFSFGILCFTVSKVFANYYLVKKIYIFTWASTLLAALQFIMITLYHNGIRAIAWDMTVIWILHLLLMFSLHIGSKYAIKFEQQINTLVLTLYKMQRINLD